MINLINVGYGSANYYAVAAPNGYLLIDAGMPGTTGVLLHNFKRAGLSPTDLRYLLITHLHPDHCGIAQDLQMLGIQLMVCQVQVPLIDSANDQMAKYRGFSPIEISMENVIETNDCDGFHRKFGLRGRYLHTPGHSPDSVSIVIKDLGTFTGDLPLVANSTLENRTTVEESWCRISNAGESSIYPAHGRDFSL